MRRVDVSDYLVEDVPFQVRASMVAVLFNEAKLAPREIIRRDELAKKIEAWPNDNLLLEDAEWDRVVAGLNATDLQPHGRSVVEFAKRILDAPDVNVKEAEG